MEKPKTKFEIERARQKARDAIRRADRRNIEVRMREQYPNALAVYAGERKVDIWFSGKTEGAKYLKDLNESVLTLPIS